MHLKKCDLWVHYIFQAFFVLILMIISIAPEKLLEYFISSLSKLPFKQFNYPVSLEWYSNNGEDAYMTAVRMPQGWATYGHDWKGWLFTDCVSKAYYVESWLERKSLVGKDANAIGVTVALRGKKFDLSRLARASRAADWGWCHSIKSFHTQTTSEKVLRLPQS